MKLLICVFIVVLGMIILDISLRREDQNMKTYLFNIKFFAELSEEEADTLWDELDAAVSLLVPDTYIDIRCEEC